jgi:pimeloyl-ACP methyl ester carboxylesterase
MKAAPPLAGLGLALCAALYAGPAGAGDSCVMIQFDVTRRCPADCGAPVNVPRTPAESLALVERALTVREARLPGHFSNGTFGFCTGAERREFVRGVVAIGLRPHLTEEGWWEHMLFVSGSRTSLAEVEARLGSKTLDPRARARLERAASALRGALKL